MAAECPVNQSVNRINDAQAQIGNGQNQKDVFRRHRVLSDQMTNDDNDNDVGYDGRKRDEGDERVAGSVFLAKGGNGGDVGGSGSGDVVRDVG